MKFQSEKKELWRYASKNLTAPVRGMNSQQPLLRRLPHQHVPQSVEFAMMTQHTLQQSMLGYCEGYSESSISSTTAINISSQENVNTPPPPYSSVPELNCSSKTTMRDYCLTCRQPAYPTDGEMEASLLGADSDLGYCLKRASGTGGCNYVNSAGIMLVINSEELKDTSTSSSCQLPVEQQQKVSQPKTIQNSQAALTSTITTTTTSTASFAATAAKILRNCCGGTFGSSNSLTPTRININTNNNATSNACSMLQHEHFKRNGVDLANNSNNYLPEQFFNNLMKQLKASQISLLLKAVKSRQDPVIPTMSPPSASSTASTQHYCVANYQTNCILIRRAEILGEEPYVIACRLFFWRDIKCASQLKRLPVCPNERDPVYVCCNPLHWCRILETDTAPPPYQSRTMNCIEGLNSENEVNSTTFGITDPENIQRNYSDIRRTRHTESVTTDGEERNCSANWCEVAYWEMAQRVGERFPADTPTINIFSDKPHSTSEEHKGGMCLKDLMETRRTPSPEDVQYTRQKIGLGVTLSQETDGVWLYNRSNVPIFVYSPTLTESWYRVCRVEPGDCIRAFDKYRAQTLVYPGRFAGVQTGPIDKFSMRISFGKGWGYSYKRPDITLCPCWLEVLFKPQR